MTKRYFLATVEFVAPHKLSDLAHRLGEKIGIALLHDESGRYDEVPAFVGKHAEIDLSLLGAPEDHPTTESVLKIRMGTELPFEVLCGSIPVFFHSVLIDKSTNARGYVDCSDELAHALRREGFTDCSPIR